MYNFSISKQGDGLFVQKVRPLVHYIKRLIKKYRFDDKVIFTLFEYCKSKEHLEQEYISVVAESWNKHNIIKGQDLENYFIKCMEEERRLKRKY